MGHHSITVRNEVLIQVLTCMDLENFVKWNKRDTKGPTCDAFDMKWEELANL